MDKARPIILVTDDELSIRESFGLILEDSYNIVLAASGEAALKKVVDEKVDLAYLDIRMPGMDGLETLKRIKEIDPSVEVIMVTAVNDMQKASQAIKLGARDYVIKPFDVSTIQNMTKKILEIKDLSIERRSIKSDAFKKETEELVGNSPKIKEVLSVIETISSKEVSTLLYCEKGVEAEIVAKLIHEKSARAAHPFKTIYISDEPEDTQRYKIFGSEHGESTSMLEKEKGMLEKSMGGTLLLFNIENLEPAVQNELAKVLKEKHIKKEGSSLPIPISSRIICATSINLKERVSHRSFTKDLYDVISETYLEIPALRDRSSDIPILISYYIEKYNIKYNKNIKDLSKDCVEILTSYYWPGNVEELKRTIENLVLTINQETITSELLPMDILLSSSSFISQAERKNITLDALWSSFEKNYIKKILEKFDFDEAKVSKILGLKPIALQAKIETLGLIRK